VAAIPSFVSFARFANFASFNARVIAFLPTSLRAFINEQHAGAVGRCEVGMFVGRSLHGLAHPIRNVARPIKNPPPKWRVPGEAQRLKRWLDA
jgi:hypothetical protein